MTTNDVTDHTMMVEDEKSRLETFKPLILIFLFITVVSVISSIEGEQEKDGFDIMD